METGADRMSTVLILIVIVFCFCISIGLVIYEKDNTKIALTDDVKEMFDKVNEMDDEII